MQQVSFDDRTVIDNFLPEETFKRLSDFMMNKDGSSFAYHPLRKVATENDSESEYWSWYGVHAFFIDYVPVSQYYTSIIGENFYPLLNDELQILNSIVRVKANFFPHTPTVKNHNWHQDYPEFDNKAAVFSLNTCDGYTEFQDGMKVDSVANRMVFFNGRDYHRSSTTSNAFGRFNINFNFL